jgi:prepilin-type N-terminal cleavage/methylation domain-containing protein
MKKWAFTLIEQLTAVAIIGVLAAIAVPNFMNAQIRAKIAKSQSGLRTYQTIQRMYLLEVGDIPRSY